MNNNSNHILLKTSWISTIGNFILSAAKLIVGLISGSLAVISDGIDSATDIVISIIMIFTGKIVKKPPSRKYVYGYMKAESIATKLLSIVVIYAGIQMLITSIKRIADTTPKEMPGKIAIYVTVFSIIGKSLLMLYQYKQGKKINSSLLKANAVNMRNDILISSSVLVGLIFTFVLHFPILDIITGLIISILIIKSGVEIFIDSNVELMDGVKDIDVYNKIFAAVAEVNGANNPHRVRSRQIGNLYCITLDIEVDPNISVLQAHKIASEIETKLRSSITNIYDTIVHIEPKGYSSKEEEFGLDANMIESNLN